MVTKIIETVASWPMAFHNIVPAVAAILAWNRPSLRLYGTHWVIIVTYMVLFTPIIMKQVSGILENHDESLSLAARVAGATPLKAFFTVTMPVLAPGLKCGCLLCFLIAFREIPISLMLYSSGQETRGVLLFGMQPQGLEMTSALAVIIIAMIFIGNLVIGMGKKKRKYVRSAVERCYQAFRAD